MAKRNTVWTEDKLNRYILEGRGQGEGRNYKPWLDVESYSSLGLSTRIMGYKTHRMHIFFTKLQLKYFFLLEWASDVVDIREQYPLLHYKDIVNEKSDLNIDLFTDKESRTPYVIYTTFLITFKNQFNELKMAARSIKGASELDKKSSLERLEIERRYWDAKGIDWGIVTNKDIPSIRAKNIEWLHSVMIMDEFNSMTKQEFTELADGLYERIADSNEAVSRVISQYEKDYSLEKGTGIVLYKYLIINRKIVLNMDKPIDLNSAINKVELEGQDSEEGGSDAVGC